MESALAARAVPTLRVVGCGIDGLHLWWQAPLSAGDVERLLLLKEEAAAVKKGGKLPVVTYGEQLFDVKPNAARAGPLLLDNEQMSVVLNPHPLPGMPTAMIDLKAWWLWKRGADAAVADAQKVIFELAGDQATDEQLRPRVTRVDLALDVQGWRPTLEQLAPRRHRDAVANCNELLYTRAVAFHAHVRSRFEGVDYGSKGSGISAGIYNKTLELEVSGKTWFEEIWKESGNYQPTATVNGEEVKQDVWRIEFRVRREGLTEFREDGKLEQLDTWEDVRRSLKGMWAYLTRFWLVMRGKRSKTDRLANAVTPFWQQIVDGGELHMGTAQILRSKLDKIAQRCVQSFAGYVVLGHACWQWIERNQRPTLEENAPKLLEEVLLYIRANWDPEEKVRDKLARWTSTLHGQYLGEDLNEEAAA